MPFGSVMLWPARPAAQRNRNCGHGGGAIEVRISPQFFAIEFDPPRPQSPPARRCRRPKHRLAELHCAHTRGHALF